MQNYLHVIYFTFLGIVLGIFHKTSSEKVYIRLYGKSLTDFYEVSSESAKDLLDHPYYDPLLPGLGYMYGFTAKNDGPFTQLITQSAIDAGQWNVFLFNWQKVAAGYQFPSILGSSYFLIAINYVAGGMPGFLYAGIKYGEALISMEDYGGSKFSLDRFHLLGHSLGAQAVGITGRYLIFHNRKLDRISGCDPAKELFPPLPQLDKTCAEFVDITHTDMYASQNTSQADMDFWVNEGIFIANEGNPDAQVQPDCPPRGTDRLSFDYLCSHNRCVQLFAQSFTTSISGVLAKDYAESISNPPPTTTCELGIRLDRSKPYGNYYVATTGTAPYQPVQ